MAENDNPSTEQALPRPYEPMLGVLTSSSSVHSRLAHAIANRDPVLVEQVLAEKPVLSGKFLRSSWSERVVAHFHPQVAELMKQAGMRCLMAKRLFHIACLNDDVAAYDWLFQDKKVIKDLDKKKRRKWDVGETERDVVRFSPWRYGMYSPRLRRHLLEHPELNPFLSSVASYSYISFKDAFAMNDWDEVARILRVLAPLPAPPPRPNQTAQDIPLREMLSRILGDTEHPEFFQIEEKLAHSSDAKLALSLLTSMPVSMLQDTRKWMAQEKHPDYPDQYARGKIAPDLTHALFLSSPPALLDVLRTPQGLDRLEQIMANPHEGQILLANMSQRFTLDQVVEALTLMIERQPNWRDPAGRNMAHVLLASRPSTGLATHLARHHPHMLVDRVPGLGDGLDTVAQSFHNKKSRAPSAARIRMGLLRNEAKLARVSPSGKDSPKVSQPKRAM